MNLFLIKCKQFRAGFQLLTKTLGRDGVPLMTKYTTEFPSTLILNGQPRLKRSITLTAFLDLPEITPRKS